MGEADVGRVDQGLAMCATAAALFTAAFLFLAHGVSPVVIQNNKMTETEGGGGGRERERERGREREIERERERETDRQRERERERSEKIESEK